jgi:SAM-dependent methyltransferase
MKLDSMPFHIGVTEHAANPGGLPNTYPFEVIFDSSLGLLIQPAHEKLIRVLRHAYAVGQAFGTPLAEDDFGKPYAEDFLGFIQETVSEPQVGLEIGAGVGYLTRRLLDAGWDMTSLEPGEGYRPFWSKYGVKVISDFFPSPGASGPYQLICSYGVLEHISEPVSFLKHVKRHLAPGGKAIFSVPDCTEEISAGDPSMLFHEHFNYFDAGSLERLIKFVGMNVTVTKSGFGRCLYGVAGLDQIDTPDSPSGLDIAVVESYPERCEEFINCVRQRFSDMSSKGVLGLYCGARGLPSLDIEHAVRFFDDDPSQHGKFIPPFQVAIESREQLFMTPVDYLVIMSRTFGHRIRDSLRRQGYQGHIVTLDEVVC